MGAADSLSQVEGGAAHVQPTHREQGRRAAPSATRSLFGAAEPLPEESRRQHDQDEPEGHDGVASGDPPDDIELPEDVELPPSQASLALRLGLMVATGLAVGAPIAAPEATSHALEVNVPEVASRARFQP